MKTSALESKFSKVARLGLKYTKNSNPLQVFSCGFYSVFYLRCHYFSGHFTKTLQSREIFSSILLQIYKFFSEAIEKVRSLKTFDLPPALFVFIHSSRNHSTLFVQTYDQHFLHLQTPPPQPSLLHTYTNQEKLMKNIKFREVHQSMSQYL